MNKYSIEHETHQRCNGPETKITVARKVKNSANTKFSAPLFHSPHFWTSIFEVVSVVAKKKKEKRFAISILAALLQQSSKETNLPRKPSPLLRTFFVL